MTADFPGLVQALQQKWRGKDSFMGQTPPPPPLSEVMWLCKCFPHVTNIPTLTYITGRTALS